MAKRGYRCGCGNWSIKRGDQSRKVYAENKKAHADECEIMAKELKDSERVLHAGSKRQAPTAT